MKQNKYLRIKAFVGTVGTFLFSLLLIMASCTDKFESYNTDPNRATDEDLEKDMLALGGMFPTMMVDVIPTSDIDANEYQRAQNLTGDIFSGYMAAIGQWNGSSNNSTYNLYYGEWNDVGFDVAYRIMGAWSQIKTKSEEYDLPSAFAVAEILKVMALHRICDNYGPIPYSQMETGSLGMAYDSQEDVYKAFFLDLNAAIKQLDAFVKADPDAQPLKKFDLIYKGDYRKWIVFANSLKLRLAMRMAYVEPELAKEYAQEAVNNEYGVMTSNQDNAILQTGLGIQVYHPLKVCWERYGDIRMGASMESFLKGYKDPRIDVYFSKAKTIDDYCGVRNGVVINNKSSYENMSSPHVEANDPILWMCAAEMYFLRAEGALRKWEMGGTAEQLYNKGIETSFEQRGVSGYSTYVADDTSVPANFTDRVGSGSISARTSITIKWDEGAQFDDNLERIITQKWLCMFPEGQEAWSEFRRTGYPKIFPVVRNNSTDINTDVQIRRIPFPQSQYRTNEAEVSKAITLLGGPDGGGTKLWWDKK
ncbi:MAG: SusD/RagB family nutrient-binding outer membrane lipoprotein [Bacteroides sp.]|nr:SusD/RagB family nutrient-binding outer membrane lipoprotein [Bacteroides sp.]